ncbi:hypothetical protein B4N89_13590 [Embleya scabrispora]|uniref:Uncharacterized protein n=1 Tax=Embleya scabrispora TaxID=159449 RepID=A0A1T3NYT4_9ACTN|nr:hypothetical protein [Embleya scabrispora]OPC81831.1 hypothetical protein B4N89_13590 [Embleya scabrispora]
MRTCTTCRQLLPLDAFHRDRSRPDQRGYYCRPCHNERMRAYRARVRATRPRPRPTRRPADDVDQAAVDRAVAGDPLADMTPAERRAAVHVLTVREGLSAEQVAELLRVVTRTVQRARTATGARPAACQGCLGSACRWHSRAAA